MARQDWVWNCAVACVFVAALGNCAWAQFGEPEGEATTTDTSGAPCYCVGVGNAASSVKIKNALNSPLSSTGLDFVETPLEEVVAFLQDEYDIPIVIDVPELDDVGLDASEKITVNMRNISLRTAIRLMLSRMHLTYAIQDGVLLITTSEKAETILITCIYDIRGIVGTSNDRSKQLRQTITKCIAKETWSVNGDGEAELHFLHPGLMVVSQTQPVHDEIASLLHGAYELREAKVIYNRPEQPQAANRADHPATTASTTDPFSE